MSYDKELDIITESLAMKLADMQWDTEARRLLIAVESFRAYHSFDLLSDPISPTRPLDPRKGCDPKEKYTPGPRSWFPWLDRWVK